MSLIMLCYIEYIICVAIGSLVIIWKQMGGIMWSQTKEKKIFVSEESSLLKENHKSVFFKNSVVYLWYHYTDGIILQAISLSS